MISQMSSSRENGLARAPRAPMVRERFKYKPAPPLPPPLIVTTGSLGHRFPISERVSRPSLFGMTKSIRTISTTSSSSTRSASSPSQASSTSKSARCRFFRCNLQRAASSSTTRTICFRSTLSISNSLSLTHPPLLSPSQGILSQERPTESFFPSGETHVGFLTH